MKNPILTGRLSWSFNVAPYSMRKSKHDIYKLHVKINDAETDAWVSNKFYGEMHPIDMLVNGYVHEKIKGIKK